MSEQRLKEEPIGYKFDTNINKPVLMKRCDNYYYAYPSKTGWIFYRSRYLGNRDKEIIDINFNEWAHKVLDVVIDETKEIRTENTNLKQALNEIKKVIIECKMLIPHEFDWEEQVDNILQIIDKCFGGSENENN